MIDIDFLPPERRLHRAQRHTHVWRVVVLVGFAALLTGTAASQYARHRAVERQLATVTDQEASTKRECDELARLEADHAALSDSAALYTYLRHPWPRTQILAAVLNPLPDEIHLEELTVARREPPDAAGKSRVSRLNEEAEQDRLAKLTPAQRDEEKLREETDKLETVVILSGKTTQGAVLHRYLGELVRSNLLAKAELDSLEEDTNADVEKGDIPAMKFTATITVRPGHGQPKGPAEVVAKKQ